MSRMSRMSRNSQMSSHTRSTPNTRVDMTNSATLACTTRRGAALAIAISLSAVALGVTGGFNSASSQGTAASAPAAKPAASTAIETFQVDAGHSVTLFRVKHMGAAFFWGRFDSIAGTIRSDSASANGLAFDLSIDINSINTASTQRDNHLKAPDFFSAKEFPTMTFKSTSAKKLDDNFYEVAGDLTMRGVTKPITARVEWTGTADMGMGRRIGFEAIFTVKRSDFGVSYGVDKGALGDDVRVVAALEGVIEK